MTESSYDESVSGLAFRFYRDRFPLAEMTTDTEGFTAALDNDVTGVNAPAPAPAPTDDEAPDPLELLEPDSFAPALTWNWNTALSKPPTVYSHFPSLLNFTFTTNSE